MKVLYGEKVSVLLQLQISCVQETIFGLGHRAGDLEARVQDDAMATRSLSSKSESLWSERVSSSWACAAD